MCLRKHISGDRIWRIGFAWALVIVLIVLIGVSVKTYLNTRALERANCTIIRLVDAGVAAEEQAAESGRRLLRTSPPAQLRARKAIIAGHELRARRGREFANSLRADISCPPKS